MIEKTEAVQKTADHVKILLSGEHTGHDWWHLKRVWQHAIRIGKEEKAELFIVELAVLLHDVADWKFHGGDDSAGPREAKAWLEKLQVDGKTIERVCTVIKEVSFKGAGVQTTPSSLEGKVVQDADRLDALGAMGIARAFAYGGHKGQKIFDPDISPVLHASFEEYKNRNGTTVNHFYEKLLLLKDRMNTATGRAMAEQRHDYLVGYLERFHLEWEGKA